MERSVIILNHLLVLVAKKRVGGDCHSTLLQNQPTWLALVDLLEAEVPLAVDLDLRMNELQLAPEKLRKVLVTTELFLDLVADSSSWFINLGEILSTVVEDLLEMTPTSPTRGIVELQTTGQRRRTSGSYYTHASVAQAVVRVSLDQLELSNPLDLKICDPACGTGVFLTMVLKQLSSQHPSLHARLVSECLYGVDRNPVSVDVTRIALWVLTGCDASVVQPLLTHVRCGDSLTGGVTSEVVPTVVPPQMLTKTPIDESLNLSNQKIPFQQALEKAGLREGEILGSTRLLKEHQLSIWLDQFFRPKTKDLVFYDSLSDFWSVMTGGEEPSTMPNLFASQKNRFLNWSFAFPEVFGREQPGFDLVVGNPPWEVFKLQEKDWLQQHGIANPRKLKEAKEWVRAISEVAQTRRPNKHFKDIAQAQELYHEFLTDKAWFVRTKDLFKVTYEWQGKGDMNYYKLFMERAFKLTRDGGVLGLVLPFNLTTDQEASDLRQVWLNQTRIHVLAELISGKGQTPQSSFFPSIDVDTRVALLVASKNHEPAVVVPLVPHLTDISELGKLREYEAVENHSPSNVVPIPLSVIKENHKHTIPYLRSVDELEVRRKVNKHHPLEDTPWVKLRFTRGWDATNTCPPKASEEEALWDQLEHLTEEQKELRTVPVLKGGHMVRFAFPNKVHSPAGWARTGKPQSEDWFGRTDVVGWMALTNPVHVRRRTTFARLPPDVVVQNGVYLMWGFKQVEVPYVLGLLNSMVVEWDLNSRATGPNYNSFHVKQVRLPPFDPTNPVHWALVEVVNVVEEETVRWANQKEQERSSKKKTQLEWQYLPLLSHVEALAAHVYELTPPELAVLLRAVRPKRKQWRSENLAIEACYDWWGEQLLRRAVPEREPTRWDNNPIYDQPIAQIRPNFTNVPEQCFKKIQKYEEDRYEPTEHTRTI